MGQRSRAEAIRVRIQLRSGAEQQFEISDGIYRQLQALVEAGADGAELCKRWLPEPMLGDPPVSVDVSGTLEDGTAVHFSFDCKSDSTPQSDHRPASIGDRGMSAD